MDRVRPMVERAGSGRCRSIVAPHHSVGDYPAYRDPSTRHRCTHRFDTMYRLRRGPRMNDRAAWVGTEAQSAHFQPWADIRGPKGSRCHYRTSAQRARSSIDPSDVQFPVSNRSVGRRHPYNQNVLGRANNNSHSECRPRRYSHCRRHTERAYSGVSRVGNNVQYGRSPSESRRVRRDNLSGPRTRCRGRLAARDGSYPVSSRQVRYDILRRTPRLRSNCQVDTPNRLHSVRRYTGRSAGHRRARLDRSVDPRGSHCHMGPHHMG